MTRQFEIIRKTYSVDVEKALQELYRKHNDLKIEGVTSMLGDYIVICSYEEGE